MSKYLRELLHPPCKYCGVEQDFSALGLRCPLECEGSMAARIASAEAMRDRMIAGGWQGYDDGLDGNGNMRLEEKV